MEQGSGLETRTSYQMKWGLGEAVHKGSTLPETQHPRHLAGKWNCVRKANLGGVAEETAQ